MKFSFWVKRIIVWEERFDLNDEKKRKCLLVLYSEVSKAGGRIERWIHQLFTKRRFSLIEKILYLERGHCFVRDVLVIRLIKSIRWGKYLIIVDHMDMPYNVLKSIRFGGSFFGRDTKRRSLFWSYFCSMMLKEKRRMKLTFLHE